MHAKFLKNISNQLLVANNVLGLQLFVNMKEKRRDVVIKFPKRQLVSGKCF